MAEVHVAIAALPALVSVAIAAVVLIIVGALKKKVALRSVGFILLGLAALAAPMAYFLDKVGDTWHSWEPTSLDVLVFGVFVFLGGISFAVGLLTSGRFGK